MAGEPDASTTSLNGEQETNLRHVDLGKLRELCMRESPGGLGEMYMESVDGDLNDSLHDGDVRMNT